MNEFLERAKTLGKEVEEKRDKQEKAFVDAVQKFLGDHEKIILNKLLAEIKNAIVDKLMEINMCPAMTIPDWECEGFEMGKEDHCKGANFMNCPVFNNYIRWRIQRKFTPKKKEAKKKI